MASTSFIVPEVLSPEIKDIFETKCILLEKVLKEDQQNKILNTLQEKKLTLQQTLELEMKELNRKEKLLEQICKQRKSYELETEVEKAVNSTYFHSETGDTLDHGLKDLINLIKIMRNKLDINNAKINSPDHLNKLIRETHLKLQEFLENEKNIINEIALANDLPLLNGFLNDSNDGQNKCAELVGLIDRLTLHVQALESIKIDVTKD